MTRTQTRKGFTLIEILIVVIILGILAAIVIPQFTNASKEAKQSSLVTMVQSLRSQIALYKLQHNDKLPDLVTSWDGLVKTTDASGTVVAAGTANSFGPYMQAIPVNPLSNSSTVINGASSAATSNTVVGYVYDYNAGAGSGNIWGTDATGKACLP